MRGTLDQRRSDARREEEWKVRREEERRRGPREGGGERGRVQTVRGACRGRWCGSPDVVAASRKKRLLIGASLPEMILMTSAATIPPMIAHTGASSVLAVAPTCAVRQRIAHCSASASGLWREWPRHTTRRLRQRPRPEAAWVWPNRWTRGLAAPQPERHPPSGTRARTMARPGAGTSRNPVPQPPSNRTKPLPRPRYVHRPSHLLIPLPTLPWTTATPSPYPARLALATNSALSGGVRNVSLNPASASLDARSASTSPGVCGNGGRCLAGKRCRAQGRAAKSAAGLLAAGAHIEHWHTVWPTRQPPHCATAQNSPQAGGAAHLGREEQLERAVERG